MKNWRFHEGDLDQRPNLDTYVAHTGVWELAWEILQTLRDLALLGCGERGVGALRGMGLENEIIISRIGTVCKKYQC